ncbi:hypothetical protein OS493_012719 [Desmophyllum pertusum]|uniref:Rab3GAP regulatory subunit C-terminal domain-containing protein n=1 Tax=Desmophyllum pertusum TaxID=174260 RepID=A0A9W9ZE78_9CNID|nr:hypothetical protein OS493_012719 [Desmophyllum pertusum]
MNLIVSGWLLDPELCYDRVDSMLHLHSLVSTISTFPGGLPNESPLSQSCDNAISPWWENIRHTLAQSTATSRALSFASVCRAVAMEISTASKKVENAEEADREELAAGTGYQCQWR